jgi:hypothetical protein
VAFAFANGSIILFSFVSLHPHKSNDIPRELSIIIPIVTYGLLMVIYLRERAGFKNVIRDLEIRQKRGLKIS